MKSRRNPKYEGVEVCVLSFFPPCFLHPTLPMLNNSSLHPDLSPTTLTLHWEEEGHKSYNIQALWQCNRDLGLISDTSSQHGPGESSGPGDDIDSSYPLSEVPPGRNPSQSKQEINQEQRTIALKDITRLLELVTVQEEKYEERPSPHSNFYRRHMMVQQFLQIQLKTKSSPMRHDLSMSIARSFSKGQGTAQNIVRWEKS